MTPTVRRIALAVALALLTACAPSTTATPPTTTPPSPPTGTVPATPTPTHTSTPQATLASCPPARDRAALTVVHQFGTVSPDDITVDASGRIWVTAREANQLIGMDSTGGALTTQQVLHGPEGVVADGAALYVAAQDTNAIVEASPTQRTVVTFPNSTANAGIDGVAIDAANHRLLVPDSPTGQLFAVPLSGTPTPQLLAAPKGRPVAAATDPAGTIYIASESTPGLVALTPAGATRTIGHFTDLDEVAWFSGLLFVTELDRRDVVAVDPTTGAAATIATNLPTSQGLAVTATGTLFIVDSTTNTLYSMPACGAG